MAIETFLPNAGGDQTGIAYQHPSEDEHWDKVDDPVSDGNATYVYTALLGGQKDLYNIPLHTTLGSPTIEKIEICVIVRSVTGLCMSQCLIKTYGTRYEKTNTVASTSWATRCQEWVNNPYTEGPWTWDEIDALQIGVDLSDYDELSTQNRCTRVWCNVYYEELPPELGRSFFM